jgi:single-stranded DNA-binding protein
VRKNKKRHQHKVLLARRKSMAYERNSDKKPTFAIGEFSGEGNMVEDPKELGSGDNTFIAFKVAFNSRNYKEYEGSLFVSCTASGPTAERILADGHKGKQVVVKGDLFVDEPWENKEGDLIPSYSMKVRTIGESWKWPEKNAGGGGGSRRSRDDSDDEPRGRSGRSSSRGSSDDDEPRGRSGRSSRSSRDEEPADEPRGRSSRSSRGDSDDEPRGGRTRRSRGSVEDNGDSVDD